uniref:Uncharacterized protein n=1 Tax=Arundo donax TaxID=35708 RepID=A0A0A8XZB4_ARUDO
MVGYALGIFGAQRRTSFFSLLFASCRLFFPSLPLAVYFSPLCLLRSCLRVFIDLSKIQESYGNLIIAWIHVICL